MVVQHNIAAANTARHSGIVAGLKKKSIEKLSSGYRINRAADDAAGLSISEKLRFQVRGLNKASQNALDGISLIQTAEGALNEVHSILQRMNELSVQAANDTNTSIDRAAIQTEIGCLTEEIDRIGDSTVFNTKKLLCGLWQEYGVAVGTTTVPSTVEQGSGMKEATVTIDTPQMGSWVKYKNVDYKIADRDREVYRSEKRTRRVQYIDEETGETKERDEVYYVRVFDHYEMAQKNLIDKLGREVIDNTEKANEGKDYNIEVKWPNGNNGYGDKTTYKVYFHAPLEFQLQVGALSGQGVTASIDRISAASLDVEDIRLDSYENAGDAMERTQKAIDKVSAQRSKLGATQNRLEHTIANLDNTAENLDEAESRIRDTDMAKEMVEYSKQSILDQVIQTMLSQGVHSNEGVLTLLQ